MDTDKRILNQDVGGMSVIMLIMPETAARISPTESTTASPKIYWRELAGSTGESTSHALFDIFFLH